MKNIIILLIITSLTISAIAQKVGIGTNNPVEKLEVAGAIKIGNTTNSNTGTVRWSGADFEGYDGTQWVSLTKQNTNWGNTPKGEVVPNQKVISSNNVLGGAFGQSVSIDSNYAVIGDPSKTVGGNTLQGSVYIFKKTGASWTEDTILTASNGTTGDQFGYSVSISGDYIIVGAFRKTVGGNTNQGSAYIFKRTGIGTTWNEETILTASNGTTGDNFGYSVSISGDYAIAGAHRKTVGGNTFQGSAYIFKRTGIGTTWNQETILTASNGITGNFFGYSVSISGDYAIVGAHRKTVGGNTFQGSAYIYKRTGIGTTWNEETILNPSNGTTSNFFGYSVSISGEYVIVGAYNKTVGGNNGQGSAYIFRRTGIGTTWNEETILNPSNGASSDSFGYSVSISGEYVIVGAYNKTVGGNNGQGTAYIFKRIASSWNLEAIIYDELGSLYQGFGKAVSISGSNSIIGANNSAFFIER